LDSLNQKVKVYFVLFPEQDYLKKYENLKLLSLYIVLVISMTAMCYGI